MANIVTLFISLVMQLFLPKILGVRQFSYWQLYLFYGTYIMYSSLGWCDGLYLKYGGKDYDSLDSHTIAGQFWYLLVYQTIFATVFSCVFMWFNPSIDRRFVILLSFISTAINIMRFMLQYILQSTNRIKEYSIIVIVERLLFLVAIILTWIINTNDYKLLVFSEVFTRLVGVFVGLYYCKRVIFAKIPAPKEVLKETKDLIKGGYKLLVANLTSQLIIGIVRFAIDNHWGTETFGKVSLTLSMSNMLITCISAVGVVLFPTLRRTSKEKLPRLYKIMRNAIVIPSLGILVFYMPMKLILSWWLPQYAESLKYLAILLPMCIFEGRTQLIINTYLNTLRKEIVILTSNIITVVVSFISTGLCVYVFGNLDAAVASIIFMLMFKCFLAEIRLSKILDIDILADYVIEVMMTLIFIVSSWIVGGIIGMLIYIGIYILYLLVKKNVIKETIYSAKEIIGR